MLVENEKVERARQQQIEEREEMERLQRAMETMHGADHFDQYTEEETERGQSGESDQHVDESDFDIPLHQSDGEHRKDHDETSHSHSASPPHPKSSFERPGMCVICQDEDANIAIIDCGYVIYLFLILIMMFNFFFSFLIFHLKVIWRCVEDVLSWS